MVHWLSLEIGIMLTNISWCTDVLWKSGKCSQMCHDAVTLFSIWKRFANAPWCTDSFWDLRKVHSCVMMHWCSFKIWKTFANVSWCTDFLVTSGECSQMWHVAVTCLEIWTKESLMCYVALTSPDIWKKFTNVSWCNGFLPRSGKGSLMCHVALIFFWNLKNVLMHWLFLVPRNALTFSWRLKNSLMCDVALASLETWKQFTECAMIHSCSFESWKMLTTVSSCSDSSWDLKKNH